VTLTPVPQSDLKVVKTVNNSTPKVGETVTFTIKVTNNGPSAATGVTVTDILQSGFSYVSSTSGTGSYNTGTGVWTIGNLAVGAEATLTMTAKVQSAGTYVNTAVVKGNEDDPDTGNNTSTVTLTPVPQSDLKVVKTVNNSTPKVGETVTFTIKVTNNGPSAATGVTVTDILQSGFSYVSSTSGTGSYNTGTGVWTIGNLAVGAEATLTMTAKVQSAGTYVNTAVVKGNEDDPDTGNNTSTVTLTPVPQSDLKVVKTVNNSTPKVGETVTFSIKVTNNGPSAATGVTVTDILQSGFSYVSSTAGTGSYNTGTGVWTIGNLAVGAEATLTMTARVQSAGTYVNTAVVKGNEDDPDTGNNTSTVTLTPVPQSDLKVVKTVNNSTPKVGETVTFTIKVTNNGPSAATGVVVTDVLQTGYAYVSSTASAGSYNTGLWTIGNLAVGAEATLTITAKVQSTGNYVNTAVVKGNEDDPDTSNNTSTVTPTVTPDKKSDLSVIKSMDKSSVSVGDKITFTIKVTNYGPDAATGVIVKDILPSGYSYVSSSTSTGSYNATSGQWSIGNLGLGQTVSLSVTATVLSSGNYSNTATVSGNESDPDTSNNSSTVTPTVVTPQQSDLSVLKSVSNSSPKVGETITFTIKVTNNGPSAATGVKVTDLLPSGYSYVSSTTATGSYNVSTGIWSIGTLSVGSSVSLSVTVKVLSSGSYSNTATVSGNEGDPDTGNNTSTVTPTVVTQVSPILHKSATEPVMTGDNEYTWTYIITIENPSSTVLSPVQVTDNLSAVFSGKNCSYQITGMRATGGLQVNSGYNGSSDQNLLQGGQSVAGNSKDSILIQIKATTVNQTSDIVLENQAFMSYTQNGLSGTSGSEIVDTTLPYIYIFVPDGFTPNGDMTNDKFVIEHSGDLRIAIQIYNRWGNKVYESEDYRNDWGGEGVGNFLGTQLPNGTYFCTYRAAFRGTDRILVQSVKAITLRR
jgi:uncharacterized repeat protein (TIGR01451 family)/gliding motility-associated-like protein